MLMSRCSEISQAIITIQIGEERFNIHEGLLIAVSPYFKAAFEGGFKEAKDGVLPVEDVEIKVMHKFLDWLYYDWLPDLMEEYWYPREAEEEKENGEDGEHATENESPSSRLNKYMKGRPMLLTSLYIFADRFDVPQLRKDIIAVIHKHYGLYKDSLPPYAGIIMAFGNLPASSPLCKVYIDLYAFRWNPEYYDEGDEKAAQQFLPADFTLSVMNGLGTERWNKLKDERYKTPSINPIEHYDEESRK